jgi:DNA-binding CsgD family transcriptional regulator
MSATPLPRILGRRRERRVLDTLLGRLRAGHSSVLVLRGEAGVGKSLLLEHLVAQSSGLAVTRTQGVEADMEMTFAALQQVCAPFFDELPRLPVPQRDALTVAFGMALGPPPDRFLVGLAVLSLLTRASESRPVLVVVDDAHWLDQSSLRTLEFVSRRLLAEAVAVVFSVRSHEGRDLLVGLPELAVEGLPEEDAGRLLDGAIEGPLDPAVRSRLVAETHGNPLAILELSRGRTAGELSYGLDLESHEGPYAGRSAPDVAAGRWWAPTSASARHSRLSSMVTEDFRQRVEALPDDTRTLLLLAAAEPVGDLRLLVRAAELMGVPVDAGPAKTAGLIKFGRPVQFRHPLARSAAYLAADPSERRRAHRALADATDSRDDPDRRAWHSAMAVDGVDESVAADLEAAAERARQRGGLTAEAVLLERAAELTPDPWVRGRRALSAAEAHFSAASGERAGELASLADVCPLTPLDRARLTRLRSRVLFSRSRTDQAVPLMLEAASAFSDAGSPLARETYLEAISACVFSGRVEGDTGARAAAVAARGSGAPASASEASDLLLDGVVAVLVDGVESGLPLLYRSLDPLLHEELSSREAVMRWLLSVPLALESFIHHAWDLPAWEALSFRAVRLARDIGALSVLPAALIYAAGVHIHRGDLELAAGMIEEADGITAATGNAPHAYASLVLSAWRGDEAQAARAVQAAQQSAVQRGERSLIGAAGFVRSVLDNGLGRHDEALAAARAAADRDAYNFVGLSLVELAEAAVHLGETTVAREALARLQARVRGTVAGWAGGALARTTALVDGGASPEPLYQLAIEEFARDGVTVEVARTHLLLGEHLRRRSQRKAAREHLRTAFEMFEQMGALAFTERARRELQATGEHISVRTTGPVQTLTPQESRIADLAAAGLTNPQIGAELFLSPHTVEWHLRNVYTKLDIGSRRELHGRLAARRPSPTAP